jgi:hypothetical protein
MVVFIMAALNGKLTKKLVESLGAGRHGDGAGLYLVVDPSGARAGSCALPSKTRKTARARRCALTLVWVARIS